MKRVSDVGAGIVRSVTISRQYIEGHCPQSPDNLRGGIFIVQPAFKYPEYQKSYEAYHEMGFDMPVGPDKDRSRLEVGF